MSNGGILAENQSTTPKRRGRPPKQEVLQKAMSDASAGLSRLRLSEIGTTALQKIRDDTKRMQNLEIKWPTCINTWEAMKLDATVSLALDLKYKFVEKAFNKYTISYNKQSTKSKEAADFIKWCFQNLDRQTIRKIAGSAATFNEYGFSCFEKVYTKITKGKYLGKYDYRLSKLAFRPQASLDRNQPFKFSEDGRDIIGIWQNPNSFDSILGGFYVGYMADLDPMEGSVFIPIQKIALFAVGDTDSNPAGISPLAGCYKAYREKVIVENLEVVGASKDLG